MQELLGKSTKIFLFTVVILLALGITGIDLTGLAIVGGAIGVGVGFGLQTVVSNLRHPDLSSQIYSFLEIE